MPVIATAGHVDHGKSTLVQALTGIDPDRLAEEKARGLTIDLGFAWTTLGSGAEVGFVDVPGHVRFIENMLAGVGGVDGCLLVVAADDGWMPQSEEHLQILDLLGVTEGVVAVTKAATVPPEHLERVCAAVEQAMAGSPLARAPRLAVDAPAGVGVEDLRAALDRIVGPAGDGGASRRNRDDDRPRLWIDRCFSARGSGTVVTGTLTGGTVHVGDDLHAVPGVGPSLSPVPVRVRGVQTHRRVVDEATAGQRVALNLRGPTGERVPRSGLRRGQALVRLEQWWPTRTVDAELQVLSSAPAPVGRRGAHVLHVGSAAHPIRLRVLGPTEVVPGEKGCVRLHLPVPLALRPGDRYVLRDVGRSTTVGGGEVLDVAPVVPASRARPDRSVERVVAERGHLEPRLLERLTGERRRPNVGRWVADQKEVARAAEGVRARVADTGPLGLDLARLDDWDRDVVEHLADQGEVTLRDGRAFGDGGEPDEALAADPFLASLETSPFAPPSPAAEHVERSVLRRLVSHGLVKERDGHYFAASAVTRAAEVVAELLARHPEGVTASQVRTAFGTSRRHALPLLALLDAEGFTRRRGDLRTPGPRLADGKVPDSGAAG